MFGGGNYNIAVLPACFATKDVSFRDGGGACSGCRSASMPLATTPASTDNLDTLRHTVRLTPVCTN